MAVHARYKGRARRDHGVLRARSQSVSRSTLPKTRGAWDVPRRHAYSRSPARALPAFGRYLEFKRPAGTSTKVVGERAGRHLSARKYAPRLTPFALIGLFGSPPIL